MLPDLATIIALLLLSASVAIYWRLRSHERHAETKAREIIDAAKTKSLEIISASEVEADSDSKIRNAKLQEISAEQLQEFKDTLQTISKSLQSDIQVELAKFRKALEFETLESQKFVADKVQKDYEAVLAAIQEYRQQKEQEISARAEEITRTIVKKIAGKIIPEDQHHQLVIKALKQAHDDGLL